jgi:hypothetical protein
MQKKIGTTKNAANSSEGPRNTLNNVFGVQDQPKPQAKDKGLNWQQQPA